MKHPRQFLARSGLQIPMPDRDNRLMPSEGEGVTVDLTSNYYRQLLDDGDIVEVKPRSEPAPVRGHRSRKGA